MEYIPQQKLALFQMSVSEGPEEQGWKILSLFKSSPSVIILCKKDSAQ